MEFSYHKVFLRCQENLRLFDFFRQAIVAMDNPEKIQNQIRNFLQGLEAR